MDRWNKLKSHFESDGSLRDIIVTSESLNTWDLFFDALNMEVFPYTFFYAGVPHKMPNDIKSIWELQDIESTMLSIYIGGILINCHFMRSYEIEFDVDPKDINSKSDFVVLLEFLSWLNESIRSSVVLTHENSRDEVILSVE